MNFYAVIDSSAIVWDKVDFYANSTKYFDFSTDLMEFLHVFGKEKPKVFLRKELLYELINGFPVFELNERFPQFWELSTLIYDFFTRIEHEIIEYDPIELTSIGLKPNMIKSYYTEHLKQELIYQFSAIHCSNCNFILFSFIQIWDKQFNCFSTIYDNIDKNYQTIVCETKTTLSDFFAKFKRIFKSHSDKHHNEEYFDYERNEMVAAWTYENQTAQNYLENAIKSRTESKRLFNFDYGQNVFLIFPNTLNNEYHGFIEKDVCSPRIPNDVKKHFLK